MPRRVPWLRVTVEGLVIVVSILLAFGLQAWWESRQERIEELETLARVYDELESDLQRLQRAVIQTRIESAALEVANLAVTGTSRVEVPDTILAQLLGTPTFETLTPTLDGLRQSGRMSIIRDAEVRARIAAWERAVTNLWEWEQRAGAFVNAQVVPALSQRGDVGRVLQNARPAGDIDPGRVTELRIDLELKNLVSRRHASAAMAHRGLGQLATAVDSLMASIRSSLDSR
jgi:hypothetical protein